MKKAWLPLRESFRCASSPRPFLRNNVSKPFRPFSTTPIRKQELLEDDDFPLEGPREKRRQEEKDDKKDDNEKKIFYARLIPDSPSYFTAQPTFTDDLLLLQNLLHKYAALPTVPQSEVPRAAWGSHIDYKNITGETITASGYSRMVKVLKRLNTIHPELMPADVEKAMSRYKRDINPFSNVAKVSFVNEGGISVGAGRRKSAWAHARLIEGTGEVFVNGKTLVEAFGRYHDRESAIWPLKATDRIDKYNVWAKSSGGGTTGQAEALALAVAKALLGHEPGLKPALRRGKSLIPKIWCCDDLSQEYMAKAASRHVLTFP